MGYRIAEEIGSGELFVAGETNSIKIEKYIICISPLMRSAPLVFRCVFSPASAALLP